MHRALMALSSVAFLLAACAGLESEQQYPDEGPASDRSDPFYRESEDDGGLFGEEGLFSLGTGGGGGEGTGGGIGVNGHLWRASLDTLAFMPLVSADPFGGVIITDWYANEQAPSERVKMTVYILDKRLRADGIRVNVFRQVRREDGAWVDASINPDTPVQIENAILTRARELRIDSLQ